MTSQGEGRYALSGELTFATVPRLWRSGNHGFGDEKSVRLDLQGITRVDSAGIALLIEFTRSVRRAGGDLLLENPSRQLLDIATVSGLDQVLPFAASQAAN